MTTSYGLPSSVREFGLRSGPAIKLPMKSPAAASVRDEKKSNLDGPDEKVSSPNSANELQQSFIPLTVARAKMSVLSDELAVMKSKHLALIEQITEKYEKLTADARTHFEGVVDEVKARASLKLKENKAMIEELREELVQVQEAQALKNQQYRAEVKAALQEQGKLQQELLSHETEMKELREQHERDVVALDEKRVELETMLATRVAKEEYDALTEEKTALEAKIEANNAEFEAKLLEVTRDSDEKQAKLAELEAQLQQVKENEEQLNGQLTQARTELDELRQSHETATGELQTANGDLQAKLVEQEAKVAALEQQVLIAQASGGGGSGGDGPARIITVPDPELQSKVRSLENELNKILKENVDLCKVITEREEAITASNDVLQQVKRDAKDQTILGSGSASSGEGEPGEGDDGEPDADQKSEYEDVETEEEVEEMIPDPAGPSKRTTTSSSTPVDEHAERRAQLQEALRLGEEESTRLQAEVAGLERDIKPKVLDYKTRLAEFKTDSERKELELTLGYNKLVEEDGTEHELRPADVKELEDLLQWSEAQAVLKPQLAARVGVLKENKKNLESNKTLLADLKNTITEMKAADPPTPAEEIQEKEKEFLALRTQMQADANELKTSYADYEAQVKDFKAQENTLQKLYTKFKIDESHEEDKPRKLSPEQKAQVERLVSLIKNKGKERDALKLLADEVNQQNGRLKELRLVRDAAATKVEEAKQELEAVPPPPAAETTSTVEDGEVKMIPHKFKRKTTRRVKKAPAPRKRRQPAAATAANGAGGAQQSLIPASLLTQLKPIDLKGRAGKYATREFVPVTPTAFKPAPTAADFAGAGAIPSSSSSSGGGNDPALQRKFDTLTKKATKLEADIEALRLSVDNKDEIIREKESELSQLREQLRIMSEGDIDSQISALSQQLEQQRGEVAAQTERHQTKLNELQATIGQAKEETSEAKEQVNKLKEEIKALQDKVKQARAAASSHASSGGGEASGGGGGGVPGGVDPAIVAELEQARDQAQEQVQQHQATIDELNAKVAALEADIHAHSGSLSEQLAQKEAELTEAHNARITELETQVQDNTEKLRLAKKKLIELRDALTEETAKREGLEATVVEKDQTIHSMESSTQEALASVEGLKGEISERESVIAKKEENIAELLAKQAQLEKEVEFLAVRNAEEVKRRKEFQFKYEDAKGKVRVYARVRPFSKQEIVDEEKTLLRPGTNEWTLCINETQKNYQGVVSDHWRPIEFDHVFQFGLENTKGNASQIEVFEETKIFAELSIQGINCCVFAYGQSGTGKTFTMAGIKPNESNGMTRDLLGLKPRMIERVYEMKKELRKTHDIDISCYMLEIYLNKLEDVFWKLQTQRAYAGKEKSKWPEPPELKVRVDAKRKVTIDNSVICTFPTAEEMQEFCDAAELTRRVRKTGLNEESSRSHLIFALICTSTDKKTGKKTTGKLSLVDLAGSERADKTNVEGLSKAARAAMMEEGVAINESLRMLKSIFRVLGEANKPLAKGQKAEVVQYRGNMLTELMQDSLGGNAKTLMFVNVGPAASNISETVDSLQYGDLVKNITNEKVSADADNEEQIRFLGAQVRAYEAKYGPLE